MDWTGPKALRTETVRDERSAVLSRGDDEARAVTTERELCEHSVDLRLGERRSYLERARGRRRTRESPVGAPKEQPDPTRARELVKAYNDAKLACA